MIMRLTILLLLVWGGNVFAQKKSEPLTGAQLIDSLVKEATLGAYKDRHDTNKAKLLGTVSFLCYEYDPTMGVRYGLDALKLSEELNWPKGAAKANNSLGINYYVQGDFGNAIKYYSNSLEINDKLGSTLGTAQTLGNLSLVYGDKGDNPKALEYAFRSLKKFEMLNDSGGIGNQLLNIGRLYNEALRYGEALRYDTQALKVYVALGDKDGEATALGNIANNYEDLNEHNKALHYFEQALSIYENDHHKEGVARMQMDIGVVYNVLNKPYEAIQYFHRALRLYEEIGLRAAIAGVYTNLAESYCSIADMPQITPSTHVPATRAACLALALLYAQKSLTTNTNDVSLRLLSSEYRVLSKVQRANRMYKEALDNYTIYTQLKDSIFSLESDKKIKNIEAQREIDVKEGQIKILEQENNLKDLRAIKDKLTRKLLVSGIAVLCISALFITLYLVRRQQAEKRIADEKMNTLLKEQELKSVSHMMEGQEMERKRIAADLHDRLGSMLSTVKLYFNTFNKHINAIGPTEGEQYKKATGLLDEACDEVRKISHNLVSGELVKFGLVSALNQLGDTINQTGKLKISVYAHGMSDRLPGNLEVSLYRVVQELLNNILKHARATEVTIQVNKMENLLNIVVEDNGVGFNVETAMDKGGGMGLRNMETRVNQLSGSFSIDSGKGRGATAIIDIPINDQV